jgi:hypothetical protein
MPSTTKRRRRQVRRNVGVGVLKSPRAHDDHDEAGRRERGAGQIAGKSMRGQDRERNDRLADRCRGQEDEKDQRRERDDAGDVGRA